MPTPACSPPPCSRRLIAAGALLWGLLATTAQAAATITIVDGEATVIDGSRTLVAVEGLKVGDEAIVRTGPRAALLRLEWPDGQMADLGPDTQAMVNPGGLAGRGDAAPSLYLLRGWLKQTSPTAGSAPMAPRLGLQPFAGALVLYLSGNETWLFAEAGGLQITERDIRPPNPAALRPGEVYQRGASGRGSVSPRPSPAQMQRVPRSFRDTLPHRLAALKDRKAEPVPAPAPDYADLRDWLVAEPAIRRAFPRRFASRVKDTAFRAALAEHLPAHPEWEPLVFPERFVKRASAPR